LTETVRPQVEKARRVDISVVLPVYNEIDCIEKVHDELVSVLRDMKAVWEIIFVDDGSTDGSREAIRQVCGGGTRAVILGRNFGQTAALSAGIDAARGSIIVTMDADGQNDPADIPRMVALLGEGYEVVSGWRLMRKDNWLVRRLPSQLANAMARYVTGVPLHDFGCTLKAYDRKIFEHVRLYGEMHRFIPALASWMGAEVTEVKVNHRPRTTGRSKYGLNRILRVILDLITVKFLLSWAARPIQVFGKMGIACFLGALIAGAYVAYDKIVSHHDMTGNPMLLATVLLMVVGVQFISLGLLGEIKIRTYHESQNKPTYYIRETIG
jgi:glycosyltransferase involved in cell wall biosynthesis